MSDATTGSLTTIGIALAGDLGYGGSSTSDQGAGLSVSVASTDVLLKYTYGGDANLDGVVNGDDYSRIDSYFPQQSALTIGWLNGDFNYDGVVNGDDYAIIDSNFSEQGVQL